MPPAIRICSPGCTLQKPAASAAHLRYKNPQLSLADRDRYYAEAARVAEALAQQVPKSVEAVEAYLQAMRAELVYDARTHEVMQLLLNAPAPSWQAKPAMCVMLRAGCGLLPDWAQQLMQQPIGPVTQWRIDKQIALIAALLRWSIQRGAWRVPCSAWGAIRVTGEIHPACWCSCAACAPRVSAGAGAADSDAVACPANAQ